MYDKLYLEPKNEEDLVALKTYIAEYDKRLHEMDAEVKQVEAYLGLLENYCF